jgi:hypothetical protein
MLKRWLKQYSYIYDILVVEVGDVAGVVVGEGVVTGA